MIICPQFWPSFVQIFGCCMTTPLCFYLFPTQKIRAIKAIACKVKMCYPSEASMCAFSLSALVHLVVCCLGIFFWHNLTHIRAISNHADGLMYGSHSNSKSYLQKIIGYKTYPLSNLPYFASFNSNMLLNHIKHFFVVSRTTQCMKYELLPVV